jgi:hypothetical protein
MSTNEQTIILSPSPDDEIVVILSIEQERQIIMYPVGEKGDKGEKGDAGMTPEEITDYIDTSLSGMFFDVFDDQLFT